MLRNGNSKVVERTHFSSDSISRDAQTQVRSSSVAHCRFSLVITVVVAILQIIASYLFLLHNQWNNLLIFSLKHMMYWASFFLFLIASGIVGQIPSYTVNQGCPITQPLPAHSCLGRNTSTCWSPGVKDVDCPDHGLCCFDGCANVCDRYY